MHLPITHRVGTLLGVKIYTRINEKIQCQPQRITSCIEYHAITFQDH